MSKLIKRVELDEAEAQEIRQFLADIAGQKRIVSALERALYHYAKTEMGIDLDAENWTLHVDEGYIEYNGTAT